MWQSLKILNDFNTLTLKQVFWKRKPFLKNEALFFSWKHHDWKCDISIQNCNQIKDFKILPFCLLIQTSEIVYDFSTIIIVLYLTSIKIETKEKTNYKSHS